MAFYWQKTTFKNPDVVAINENSLSQHYRLEISEGGYDLLILSASYERDNGNFECKIKETGNGAEVKSQAYTVTILLPPPSEFVRITPSTPVAKEGETFKLTCSSKGGSPDPEITWTKNGEPIHGVVVKGGSRDNLTTHTLEFKPTIADDSSFFRCSVWNRAIREDRKILASYGVTVHYVPRVKVGPFNPLNVLKGSDAFMTCSVDANPPVTKIRWYKNDRLISHEVNHTIVNVVPSDSGSFVCVADNGVTDSNGNTGRGELELSVQFAPIVSVASDKEVMQQDVVSIPCKVSANPVAHTIIWTKEGDSSFRMSGDTLRIERAQALDSGRYFCTASNSIRPSGSLNGFEQSSNASVMIRVRHQPGNTEIRPANPVAVAGRPFTLSCGATPPGWPRPEYRWWKEGYDKQDLSRSMNYTIPAVHVSHEGRYYCQPHNHLGKGSIGSVFLTVNEAPSISFPMQPTMIRKTTDKTFSMTCRARGKPKPIITWYHNGQPVSFDGGRYRVETRESLEDNNVYVLQSTLHLETVTKNSLANSLAALDAGRYACVFDNDIGTAAKAETLLKVEHSPIVRHTYNKVAFDVGENATLSCKMSAYPAPRFEWSFNGKLLETSRRYYIDVADAADDDDVYTGNLVIRDVRPEDYGHYLCRSWNSVGDDDEKTNIQLVKKSAPDAPTHVEAVEILSDSVTIRWKEAFNGGYANTEFVISYSGDGERWRNESCRTMNPCRVTGLESRSDYVFKVMAINAGGHSSFSEEIGVTTKIHLKDMPNAFDAYFDSSRNTLSFRVESTSLRLVSKIEVRETGNTDWTPLTVVPIVTDFEEIHLKPSPNGFADMRIMLCLQSNDSWCGYEHLVKMDATNSTYLRESKGFSLENFMTIVVYVFLIAVSAALLLLCCCCWKKHINLDKKSKGVSDQESDDSAKPTSNGYYAGHDNKVLLNGDAAKLSALYASTAQSNGHIPQNYYLTDDGGVMIGPNDASPSGSNETAHSDLWMLKNEAGVVGGELGAEMPVSYHSLYGTNAGHGQMVEGSGSHIYPMSGYTYHYATTTHDDYPMGEEAINLKNSLCKYCDNNILSGFSRNFEDLVLIDFLFL